MARALTGGGRKTYWGATNGKDPNHLDNAIRKWEKSWNAIQWKCSMRWGVTLNTQTLFYKKLHPTETHLCFLNVGTLSLEKAASPTELHFKIDFQECIRQCLSVKSCLESRLLDILFQSISATFPTKLKHNQVDIVAEAHFNALDYARSIGHLLESCLKMFEKVSGSYPAVGYSTQSVTAFTNELWMRWWPSPNKFADLRMFRKTMPGCHSKSSWKPLLRQQIMQPCFWKHAFFRRNPKAQKREVNDEPGGLARNACTAIYHHKS